MKYHTQPKQKLPDDKEMKEMISYLTKLLPYNRDQIMRRALQKYYNQKKAEQDRRPENAKSLLIVMQKNECYYCHKFITHKTATIDHMQPIQRGGSYDFENLCAACKKCNDEKCSMTVAEYYLFVQSKEICTTTK